MFSCEIKNTYFKEHLLTAASKYFQKNYKWKHCFIHNKNIYFLKKARILKLKSKITFRNISGNTCHQIKHQLAYGLIAKYILLLLTKKEANRY